MSIARGLVGWWRFDGNLTDSSGSGNNGTVGAGSAAYAAGKYGRALSANGSLRIAITDTTDLKLVDSSYTISAWIKPSSYGGGGFGRILDKGVSPFSSGYVLNLNSGINGFGMSHRSGGEVTISNSIDLDVWQHIVASFDGTAITLYKNAVPLKSENVSSISSNSGSLDIANRGDNARGFQGKIDNVMIYNRALSPSEIKTLYALGSPL